jgi:chorismate mutase
LKQTIKQNGLTIEALAKEVAELKAQQNQPISSIQTEQKTEEEVSNEKANTKEQLQQQQQNETINQIHLIKVG